MYRLILSILVVSSLLLASCQLQSSDSTPRGMLSITTLDSTSQPLTGARIFLNGLPQTERTPAIIGPILSGTYTIRLQTNLYRDVIQTVTVGTGDTTRVTGTFRYSSAISIVQVTSNPAGAKIVVNEELVRTSTGAYVLTPARIVAPATCEISVALAGHRTVQPSLHRLSTSVDTTISFTLVAADSGNSVGRLPRSFAQRVVASDTTRHDTVYCEQYRGHVTMITCWFTTCEPCRHELPYFDLIYREFANRGVRFIAMTTPLRLDNMNTIRTAANEVGITFPVTLDPQPGFWMSMIGNPALGYPLNILVDTTGTIASYNTNPLTEAELRTMITGQLNP